MNGFSLPALALLALLPACAPPEVGASVPGGGLPPLQSTLSSIGQRIFTPRCASCHSGGGVPVDLTAGQAYRALVGVQASEVSTALPLVAPLDPAGSYLMLKLLDSHAGAGGWGSIMPPEGRLDDAELQAISDWISQGAQDD